MKRAPSLIAAFTAAVLLFGCKDKGNDGPVDVTKPQTPPPITEPTSKQQPCLFSLTDDDLANGVTLPPHCYNSALFLENENALRAIENGFIKNNIAADQAQSIRDKALLRIARIAPDKETIALAIRFGANPDAKNADGSGLVQTIIRARPLIHGTLDKWETLVFLHEDFGQDLGILEGADNFFMSAVIETELPQNQDKLVTMLQDMERYAGVSPEALQIQSAEINLLHIAAHTGSERLLEFIRDEKIALSPWDSRGRHALDYAAPAFRRLMARDYGMPRTQAPPQSPAASPDMSPGDYLRAFFEETTADYLAAPREEAARLIRPASDFSAYNEIRYDPAKIADNGVNPALIIAESAPDTDGHALQHVADTSRIALAVSKALGSPDWKDITTVRQNPQSSAANHLTFALRYNQDDYIVLSQSITQRIDAPAQEEYLKGSSYTLNGIPALDQGNYIYYNSAGNDGAKPCLSVDDVSFCMQNAPAHYHHIYAVRIGAVRAQEDGTHRTEWYSNRRPALCATLPLDNGRVYLGTSFAAPAAAAVEERLADIFARSAALPDGVVHEDILMAMMLSAKRDGLIDDTTNEPVATFTNTAGLTMDNRCGAGVINEQRAADLLARMIGWTRDLPGIEPTRGETVTVKLAGLRKHKQDDDRYVYNIRVPQDGILTQLRTGLPFEFKSRGAALIQIGDAPPVPLDLSPSGMSTDFRFAGHEFRAGDTIKLITTKPLLDPRYDWEPEGFIDLRMVQPNSPIARALDEISAPRPSQ